MASLRQWATPLTAGAFLLSAVTGVLMFFHKAVGLNKLAHEWLGFVLLAGALLHVAANWGAFAQHLKKPLGQILVGVFAVILALSFFIESPEKGGRGGPPAQRAVIEHIVSAPLEKVAAVAGKNPDYLVEILKMKGYSVSSPAQSVRDAAGGDRKKETEMLSAIFE